MIQAMKFSAFFLAALPAFAQFDLVLPDGTPVPPVYDLGTVSSGASIAAHFRLRNLSTAPATLATLSVAGVGFTLTAPPLPIGIPAQGAIDLTVTFAAAATGSYSAALHSDGISIILTASVLPSLTFLTDNGPTLIPFTTLDFGTLVRGTSTQRRVTVRNDTTAILTVPAISVQGASFALSTTPAGQRLQPSQSADFTITFAPVTSGPRQGLLAIGARTFPMTAVAADPPLPRPTLTVNLPTAASAQQGTIVIRYDAPAQTTGTGTITLDFTGPPDPTIAFATGSRTATFSVAPGDTQAVVAFQTGTTAGTLTFTVQLGASTAQQTIAIPPAPAAVSTTQATRASASIELRLTGYDNTRTLGPLTFTFFDATGRSLATLRSDATPDFTQYFATSPLGGTFLLRATFPVAGDPTQIASCDVTLNNSIGTPTHHIPIQ
ncbi:MAG: hypothetical protein JWP63_2123 [Candidatus Solibacter sp.]|nr:hypothetical protein [Candidatus Solibacter sp.]